MMSQTDQLITDHIDIWTSAILAKSTSGRGSNKKYELYGITKLRELILELAVRGKLVPQNPNDESASLLLEKIAAEKAQLVKEGKIKKSKPFAKIDEDEKTFDLPQGWEWTRLSVISEINPRNTSVDDESGASFVPMTLVSTSYEGVHETESRTWGEIKKGYTHFADGDIAIAKITPCFENSKAVIFSNLENGIGAGTTELHVARPISDDINTKFILTYFKSPKYIEVGKTTMTGSAGHKRVPKTYFESNPLPVPPLAEQHRIVAKVDELMLLCDDLEQQTESSIEAHATLVEALLTTLIDSANANELAQNWARLSENFDTLFTTEQSIEALKQTVLQLAVMGKLVPQNPNDEPASVLLEKIAEEKDKLFKEKKIKRTKPLPPIDDNEKPFKIPKNWTWLRLSDFAEVKGGKRLPKGHTFSDLKTDYIYLRVTDMKNGSIETDDLQYLHTNTQELISNYIISKDDLYITIAGTIGSVGKIPTLLDGANLTENAAKIVFIQVDKSWLKSYLSSELSQSQFNRKVKQMAQPKLALHRILSTIVALPPLEEQHRIVGKINELMQVCDQLKASLQQSQTTQIQLTDALVEQALA